MFYRALLFASAVMLGIFSYAPQASAWRWFSFNTPGRLRVGMVGNQARALLLKSDGTCLSHDLGTGGLIDDFEVRGSDSTTQGDNMAVVHNGQITFCGQNMNPLIQNGFFIDMSALAGDDFISSFGNISNYTWGGTGHDDVYSSGDSAEGGGGSDEIYGDHASNIDWLIGQDGVDVLCEHFGSTAEIMSGGANTDYRCGTAATISSVEGGEECWLCGPSFP
jgi:hypothetical protein